jgi:hypothetical protein
MRSARLDGCVSSPVRQISAIVWRNRPFGRTEIPVVSVLQLNRDHTVLRIGVVNLLLNSQTFGKLFRIVASRVGRRSHRQTEERRHKKQRPIERRRASGWNRGMEPIRASKTHELTKRDAVPVSPGFLTG